LSSGDDLGRGLSHPQGAPRGLLIHYILRRISQGPCHGYEILQDIDDITEGAWRPGAGSVYPILKRLLERGYIKTDDVAGSERRVYSITDSGLAILKKLEKVHQGSSQRWTAMRRLFLELMEPDQLTGFIRDGARGQFETARQIITTKLKDIPQKDVEYLLKEYKLSLEEQLDWTNQTLEELKPAVGVSRNRK
jgi:DNA-binding PadR family transcriptional regulator